MNVCYVSGTIKAAKILFSIKFFLRVGGGVLDPWHKEVPGLDVKSELQLLATATATPDLSYVGDLRHSSWQSWIL